MSSTGKWASLAPRPGEAREESPPIPQGQLKNNRIPEVFQDPKQRILQLSGVSTPLTSEGLLLACLPWFLGCLVSWLLGFLVAWLGGWVWLRRDSICFGFTVSNLSCQRRILHFLLGLIQNYYVFLGRLEMKQSFSTPDVGQVF